MRSDEQLDEDFAIIRAALKRVDESNYPGAYKTGIFFDVVSGLVTKMKLGRDDAVAMLMGMAYVYAQPDPTQIKEATNEVQ